MKGNYLLNLFGGILTEQAEKISNDDIKDPFTIEAWAWITNLILKFFPEKKLAVNIGKIIAYRMENNEDFRNEILNIMIEAGKIAQKYKKE